MTLSGGKQPKVWRKRGQNLDSEKIKKQKNKIS